MSPRRTVQPIAALVLLLIVCGLAGCSLKAAPVPASDGELGSRPGLLSGPTGEFTIYRQ